MADFIKTNFDKLLLTTIFCVALGVTVHVMHHAAVDAGSIQWVENITSQVVAALLTLMVGNRLAVRNGDSNGNSNGKTAIGNGGGVADTPIRPGVH